MHQPAIRLFKIEKYSNEPTLVVLDPGIAIEQAPKNLHNLRALFRAVIEKRVSFFNSLSILIIYLQFIFREKMLVNFY